MTEAYVQLVCPDCGNEWEENPSDLPATDATYGCPDCAESHPLAEFAKTQRDVETIRQFE